MNLLRLSWKNLTFKPLNALLSVLLFALSIGLISLLLSLRKQADEQFDNNLAGIDLVVGAKGSPLELTLNSMYHVGYATGNIKLGQIKAFFNPKHPIVEDVVPLSVGDSYRGYRIVGTIPKILDWYGAELATGSLWQHDFEVVVGEEVARINGLKLGDKFKSNHGIIDEGDENNMEHDDDFTVVGILAPSGTVMDQLVLATNQTYWHAHEAHNDASTNHDDHAGHNHAGHNHTEDHAPTPLMEEDPEKEITSLLVRYRNASSFQSLNFPRNLNENTELLAANPAYEISEVRRQFDSGQQILGVLVLAITIVSALSIFIALFTSLRERRYELALMRTMGAGRAKLFLLIILEGLIVAIIGYALGLLLSHGLLAILAANVQDDFRYTVSATRFLTEEGYLFVAALFIGFLAAVIPAVQAARTDIADTLTEA